MKFNFKVGIEVENQTGELLSAYFQVREGNVAETREFKDGDVFADYNARGDLIGIEILAPCSITLLDKIAKDAPAKKFIRSSVPRDLAIA